MAGHPRSNQEALLGDAIFPNCPDRGPGPGEPSPHQPHRDVLGTETNGKNCARKIG